MADLRALPEPISPATAVGEYVVPVGAWPVRADPALRSAEPVPAELGWYLTRQLAAARADGWDPTAAPPVAPLDTLLAAGDPLPIGLALLLLRRIATMLDAAATIGIVVGTLAPRRVVLDGRHLVLVRDDDPAGADMAYVAPEQRRAGWAADARASQYGLAVLAGSLLGAAGPAAERVLGVARDPAPEHRFSTAGDFVTALAAVCGNAEPDTPTTRLGAHPVDINAPLVAQAHAISRYLVVGALIGAVTAAGIGTGWYVGAHPAPAAGDRVAFDATVGQLPQPRAVRGAVSLPTATLPGAPAAGATAIRYDVLAIGEAEGLFRVPDSTVRGAAADGAGDSTAVTPDMPGLDGRLPALASVNNASRLGAAANLSRRLADPVEFAAGAFGSAGSTAVQRERVAPERLVEVGAQLAAGSVELRYPDVLRVHRIAGEVTTRFVVDTAGRIDPASVQVLRSSHPAFTGAVREVLGQFKYLPAESGGRRVARTVEQTFRFAPPR